MMIKRVLGKIILCLLLAAMVILVRHRFFRGDVPALAPARFPDQTLVIDAGHGGEDGGAVSFSGAIESGINLAIAQRLDALLRFYGVETLLLRDADVSLHDPSAATLREKKVSDLHNRVDIIEAVPNAVLISIHQNTYNHTRYHGAQVFYANGELSRPFAVLTQETLRLALDPENTRQPAAIPTTVYLMNHISCTAILVECGFLSNPREDALLQTGSYQTKISVALAASYLTYQQGGGPYEGEDPLLLHGVRQ